MAIVKGDYHNVRAIFPEKPVITGRATIGQLNVMFLRSPDRVRASAIPDHMKWRKITEESGGTMNDLLQTAVKAHGGLQRYGVRISFESFSGVHLRVVYARAVSARQINDNMITLR